MKSSGNQTQYLVLTAHQARAGKRIIGEGQQEQAAASISCTHAENEIKSSDTKAICNKHLSRLYRIEPVLLEQLPA